MRAPQAGQDGVPGAIPPSIPEHELLRLIGSGSGGQVWLARNALGTCRAVKIIRKDFARSGSAFDREFVGILKFEPVSRLHDGLVDILQVGRNDAQDYFYYVMELADDAESGQNIVPEHYVARTLAHDLTWRRRLPIGECVRLGACIASALGFLHRHKLIHRDIKPSNIIFVNGFPKLADIGLVTAETERGTHLGTEGFIPPEGAGSPQADIYSLGKVLYEISTGKDRSEYPELPGNLGDTDEDRDLIRFNKIVLQACRVRAFQRFRSAEDLLTELLSFQFHASDLRRERTLARWSKVIAIIGAIVGLVGVFFGVRQLLWLLRHG